MSGGAVTTLGGVVGVAAETLSSTTVVESVETITRTGDPQKIVYQRVIEYGIAVCLDEISTWTDELCGIRRSIEDRFRARAKKLRLRR